MKKIFKEFPLSSWAIDHKTVIYVIMAIFFFWVSVPIKLCREKLSEINDIMFVLQFFLNTAEDIERLIVDPLEDALKGALTWLILPPPQKRILP